MWIVGSAKTCLLGSSKRGGIALNAVAASVKGSMDRFLTEQGGALFAVQRK
jgi:hypothetical protein